MLLAGNTVGTPCHDSVNYKQFNIIVLYSIAFCRTGGLAILIVSWSVLIEVINEDNDCISLIWQLERYLILVDKR